MHDVEMIGRRVECRCGAGGEIVEVTMVAEHVDVITVHHVAGDTTVAHAHDGGELTGLLAQLGITETPGQRGPTADYD